MHIIGILIVVMAVIAGWEVFWYFMGVKPLFPWQLKGNLDRMRRETVLVDVRTRPEYNLLHIQGVSHRPDLVTDPDAYRPGNPEKPVVVICMTGHRSPVVAYRLKKRGIEEVYNLTWGMVGWKLVGGRTEGG